MPKYVTFFSYTSDAAKAMVQHPSDRAAAAKALVESVGGKLEAFYWMQGKHDGFFITEAPDGAAVAAAALAAVGTGSISGLETHEIFDHDTQATIVKNAAKASGAYKPPTA
jgi:uncharacterized protein with GYD domain